MRDGMKRAGVSAMSARRGRPSVEGLEDRRLLATTPSVTILDPTVGGTSSHITSITVGNDGSFQVHHTGFTNGQFYSPGEAPADAGLFIRHSDGTVDGIDLNGRLSAATATNAKPFHAVSQTQSLDGLTVTTILDNSTISNGPGDKEQVTQVVTYQPNKEFFTTTTTIKNTGTNPETLDLFVAGDIYLADSDRGVGLYSAASGAIGGTDATGNYHIFFQPKVATGDLAPTNYEAAGFNTIWSVIGGGATSNFNNTANLPSTAPPYNGPTPDPNYYDNGAGLEWHAVTIAAGASANIANFTGFGAITSVVPDANLIITPVAVQTVEGSNTGGVVATFTHANSTTPAAGYSATIDWGDGTTTTLGVVAALPVDRRHPADPQKFSVTATHVYTEENTTPLPVKITIVDNVASVSNVATTTATVTDAPLTTTVVPFSPTEGRSFSGEVATFTDADTFGTLTDYTATITWGDGHTSPGLIRPSSGNLPGMPQSFIVSGTNTYAEEGDYPVSVTVNDAGGASGTNLPATVNVPDSALIPVNVNVPVNGVEGVAFSGPVASFFDIDPAAPVGDYTATITFNGKTIAGTVAADPTAAGRFIVTPSTPLSFAEEGSLPISVTVFDDATNPTGATATFTVNASVADAPLSGSIAGNVGGARGSTFVGAVASFRDADVGGTATDYTATINWGDGTIGSGSIQAIGSNFQVVASHKFATEGTLPLSVVIKDAGGAAVTLVGSSVVRDAPLSITGVPFSTQQASSFGGTIATFTDGDPLATTADYAARVVWGDGTVAPAIILPDPAVAGRFDVIAGNTYAQPGTYAVGVVVTDRGGAAPAIAIFNAVVTAIPTYPLVGTLDAASDSGPSNSDHVTNVTQPTFVGTAGPNAVVQIYGQNYNSATGSLFGQGTSDALGNWRITVFSPLPDGAYSLVASANDGRGHVSSVPTRLMGGAPLFIVTSARRSPTLCTTPGRTRPS